MKNKLTLILVMLLLSVADLASAQNTQARKETRHGNKEYKAKHYDQSEVNYRRAIHADSNAYRAHYNLGNALYRQKKYDEANTHYSKALETPDLDAKTRSRILHNRGNSSLKAGLSQANRADGMQQFQQAVNDYQEALKLQPKADDTRYNLSYAKKMLQQAQQQQQQQNGGGGGGSDQDKNKDKNKDNKNDQGNQGQDKKQDQNNQGQQQNQQNQKQDQQQKQQQQKKQDQKKQDAERLLEAVKNNEKNTMKDNAKKVEAVAAGRIEKDW